MKRDKIYKGRLDKHMDELKWLYMELYNSQDMFDGLLEGMEGFYVERTERLRTLDASREEPVLVQKELYAGHDDVRGSFRGQPERRGRKAGLY